MTALIEFKNVSKGYRPPVVRSSLVKWLVSKSTVHPEVTVLKNISLQIQPGESIGIIGRNGCGKSTLLKIIAGILQPSSGEVIVRGEVLPMFSWENCFLDDLDVSDNLNLLGALVGLSARTMSRSREEIVVAAGLEGRLEDQLRSFSPGMKARLALALANKADADIILLDETLGAGDAEFRNEAAQIFEKWKSEGKAIVHVSHDLALLHKLSGRCLSLENGHLQDI